MPAPGALVFSSASDSALVGDRGVVAARVGPGAGPSHEDGARSGADGHRVGEVIAVCRAVVQVCPQLRSGTGVVGNGGLVGFRGRAVAPAGGEYLAAGRADGIETLSAGLVPQGLSRVAHNRVPVAVL
jgi:hypothetical protein